MILWIFSTVFFPQQVAGFPKITSLTSIEDTEANALLKWKDSFENNSQALLSTWTKATSPCKWEGIQCDKSKSISSINLANYGLKGKLQTFSFSSFPNLLELNIYNNFFYGTIPPQIGNLSKIIVLNFSTNLLLEGFHPQRNVDIEEFKRP